MKKLVWSFMLAFAFGPAHAQPIAYSCGPGYTVPEFEQYLTGAIGYLDAGIAFHQGVKIWYRENDTVFVAAIDPGSYSIQPVATPGSINGNQLSKMYSYNGMLYLAHRTGITESATGQHFPYPDSLHRRVLEVTVIGSVAWLLTQEELTTDFSAIRFDGASVQIFSANDPIFYLYHPNTFVHDSNIYYFRDTVYGVFNTATTTFDYFDPEAVPGFQDRHVVSYGVDGSGNIVSIGADTTNNELVLQTHNGVTWETGQPLNGAEATGWGGSGVTFGVTASIHAVGTLLVLHATTMTPNLLIVKKVQSEYFLIDTASFFGESSAVDAVSAANELFLLQAHPVFIQPGYGSDCGNANSLFLIITNTTELHNGSGTAFVDLNLNGTLDASDYGLAGANICNINWFCAVTAANGGYNILLNTDSNFVAPPAYPNFSVVPASYSLTNVNASVTDLDFAVQPLSSVNDLGVSSFFSLGPVRAGFDNDYVIKVKNFGTVSLSDTVVVALDPQYTINGVWPSPLYQSGSTVALLTGAINPLLTETFTVNVTLSNAAVLNSLIESTSEIQSVNDANPINDAYVLTQIVQFAWDPNDKAANPPYWIQDNENIQYTIRFQNTGTDTAFNVIVRDTLDTNLDWSSFELRHTAHPVSVNLNLQNGAVAFNFPNILLPDSNVNEPASHGIIVYDVKTKNGLLDGTAIENTAHIYFDFNEAVVTNTTVNVIGEPLDISARAAADLMLVPNPANQLVRVYSATPNAVTYVVTDMLGRTVLHGDLNVGKETSLRMADAVQGMYNIMLIDSSNRIVARGKLAVAR